MQYNGNKNLTGNSNKWNVRIPLERETGSHVPDRSSSREEEAHAVCLFVCFHPSPIKDPRCAHLTALRPGPAIQVHHTWRHRAAEHGCFVGLVFGQVPSQPINPPQAPQAWSQGLPRRQHHLGIYCSLSASVEGGRGIEEDGSILPVRVLRIYTLRAQGYQC